MGDQLLAAVKTARVHTNRAINKAKELLSDGSDDIKEVLMESAE